MSKESKKKRSASVASKDSNIVTTQPSKKIQTNANSTLNQVQPKHESKISLNKDLPKVLGVIDASQFMMDRMEEVNYMQSRIKQTSVTLKVPAFEPIPRRMRRGPVSHVLHKLRARDRAKLTLKLSLGKKIRPSIRKIKSKVILDELKSQKNGIKWLETHKWHIKRMKMENWWGFRLAAHPMYKSRSITYRSFTKISLLHDSSYLGCLQLSGLQSSIIQLLNRISDPFLPSVGSKRFIKGTRVGHINIYKDNEYPYQLLCPVTFLWRSTLVDNNDNRERSIWLWIHPSSFSLVEKEIKKLIPIVDSNILVVDLRKDIVRFELTGPRSLAILQAIIDPVLENDNNINDNTSKKSNNQLWHNLQHIRSGGCLPNGSVIGLTVQDPRLQFPQKARPPSKEASTLSTQQLFDLSLNWPIEISMSDIWNEEIRNNCLHSKPTETQLSQRRENNLLPGSKLSFTSKDARIPILLIQRCGPLIDQPLPSQLSTSRVEQIEGWTVIVPKGFGLPFWRSFVFAGARTGGLNDIHSMHFDSGLSCFPYDFPGTPAFEEYQSIKSDQAQQRWNKLPPAKRINYKKLNVQSPFKINFDSLIPTSNSNNCDNINHCILLQNDTLKKVIIMEKDKMSIEKKIKDLMIKATQSRNLSISLQSTHLENMFIKVCIKSLYGGTFIPGSLIYLVENEDLYKEVSNFKYSSTNNNKKILEPKNHIGYITTGDYSFLTGQGQGIGACSAIGLHRLYQLDSKNCRKIKLLVLITNVTTQEFRPATLCLL